MMQQLLVDKDFRIIWGQYSSMFRQSSFRGGFENIFKLIKTKVWINTKWFISPQLIVCKSYYYIKCVKYSFRLHVHLGDFELHFSQMKYQDDREVFTRSIVITTYLQQPYLLMLRFCTQSHYIVLFLLNLVK